MSIIDTLEEYVGNNIKDHYPITLELWLTLKPEDRCDIIAKIKADSEAREKRCLSKAEEAGKELNFEYFRWLHLWLHPDVLREKHQAFRKGLELYNGEGSAEKDEKEVLPRISADGKIHSINGWEETLALNDIAALREKRITLAEMSDIIEASKKPVVEALDKVDFAKDFTRDIERDEFEKDFKKSFIAYCTEMRCSKLGSGEGNSLSSLWMEDADKVIRPLLDTVYTGVPSYDEDSNIFTTSCGKRVRLFWWPLLKLLGPKPADWLFITDTKKRTPLMKVVDDCNDKRLRWRFRTLINTTYL